MNQFDVKAQLKARAGKRLLIMKAREYVATGGLAVDLLGALADMLEAEMKLADGLWSENERLKAVCRLAVEEGHATPYLTNMIDCTPGRNSDTQSVPAP